MKLQFRSRLPRILLGGLFFVLAVTTASGLTNGKAYAVTASDWNAGNIIDDNYFYNNTDMSVSDVQNFLNGKMPSCDTSGSKIYSGSQTRAQYGASRGFPAPYVCLKDYYENTSTHINNLSGSTPAGAISAAQIIKNAADTYGISPKVILVLLQKEQTLVTDDWPWGNQYQSATGYGCPDTAACDSQYYGFYNQVTNAARQFRLYANNPSNYRYKPYQYNTIQYNPNSGCGSSSVYISNKATAGLYNYTPYQPNASALSNLYGSGDSCGAYGNRNFWRLYNDWFGNSRGTYSWYTTGYKILNETATQYVDPGQLSPGGRYLVDVAVTNTGTATWINSGPSPVRMGTTNPQGHNSPLCDSTWITCSRPVNLTEEVVSPGQTGHFDFFIVAPYAPGNFREYFKPLAEMVGWMNESDQSLGIRVVSPGTFNWHTTGYKVLNQSATQYVDPGQLSPNQKYFVDIAVTNTGSATWSNSGTIPVRFGTTNPQNHASILCDTTWVACSRAAPLRESTVAPGQVGHFNFLIKTPSTPGQYREYFKPLAEFYSWMNESDQSLGIRVVSQ